MEAGKEHFELEFNGSMISVQELSLPGQVFFRITFENDSTPLIILRATNDQEQRFWTSMPEGRQALAERIGLLIEAFYRSKL